MGTRETLDSPLDLPRKGAGAAERAEHALVVLWSASAQEKNRAGEVLFLPADGAARTFGRGEAVLVRERPGAAEATQPLVNPFVSRAQLELRATAGGVAFANRGKRPCL